AFAVRFLSATSTWMHSAAGRARLNSCRAALFVAVFALPVLCDVASAFVSPIAPARLLTPTNIMSSGGSSSSSSSSDAVSADSGATKQLPSLPATVKGILFDMDGTLTDSDTLHFEAYRETFLKLTPSFNGGERITREYYDDWMSGNSNPAIAVEKLFPEMLAEDQTALWKAKEEVYRNISTTMTLLPGLLNFLDCCRSEGLAMILVTNAPRLDAVHTLNILGLSDRFEETMVIGYECARAKPYPDPYLEGLSRLGLPADACVAFEDSVNGVSSAVSA
ncbi:unnamed protein product, partial [Ectocarpus fasciculatus]